MKRTIETLQRIRYRLINQDRETARHGLSPGHTAEIEALGTAINELKKKQ